MTAPPDLNDQWKAGAVPDDPFCADAGDSYAPASTPVTKGNGASTHHEHGAAVAGSAEPPPIALLAGAELATPLPPLAHLVRELALVAGGGAPHLTAGYGFTGKSLAEQAKALALAAGKPVWGAYRVPDRRPVVHVDLEQGDRLTRRRYQRLAAAMGIALPELGDALAVAIMPALRLVPQHVDVWARIMDGREWLLVDSLRAASPRADENSSEIRAGLDMLGALSERTGCRATVIHHARKPRDGEQGGGRYSVRGSSAIYDACDAVHVFSGERGEPVLVETLKARSHGELPQPVCLVIEDAEVGGVERAGLRVSVRGVELLHEERERAERDKRATRARKDAQTIKAILTQHSEGLGTRALREAAGLSGERLASALAELGDTVSRTSVGPGQAVMHRLVGGDA